MTAIDEMPDGVVGDLLSYFEHDVHLPVNRSKLPPEWFGVPLA
jgi:hypothetical protein